MSSLKIGELARRSGLSVETLRYYERRGLIPPPERLPSGYRVYPPAIVQRLAFIRRCKALGFTLDETRDLLQLQQHPELESAAVKQRVEQRMTEIRSKVQDLQRILAALEGLSALCDGEGSAAECPILAFLEQDEELPRPCPHNRGKAAD
jgi:MerR family mercuric resistance operon transcriptional regulator